MKFSQRPLLATSTDFLVAMPSYVWAQVSNSFHTSCGLHCVLFPPGISPFSSLTQIDLGSPKKFGEKDRKTLPPCLGFRLNKKPSLSREVMKTELTISASPGTQGVCEHRAAGNGQASCFLPWVSRVLLHPPPPILVKQLQPDLYSPHPLTQKPLKKGELQVAPCVTQFQSCS